MNENLNLVEILKSLEKGTKLYSPIFGEVEFIRIDDNDIYPDPIVVLDKNSLTRAFDATGKYCCKYDCKYDEAECLLFPSKNQRDWSKFKVKKARFDPKTLQPFDKVLVRDSCSCPWRCAFYSHTRKSTILKYVADNGVYEYCIPYNDETKHLVGMDEEAPEFYRYWED